MGRKLTNILLVILILIFLTSGFFLVRYYIQSRQQQSSFQTLAQIKDAAVQPEDTTPPDPAAPVLPDSPAAAEADPLVTITDPETGEAVTLLRELSELYLMNNDLIGWITIPDTPVNYPIMQTPTSPDYYLRRDFYGQYSSAGCIYAREVCDLQSSDNVTIYGHRMNDGSMFASLKHYLQQDFWEENRYIQLSTLTEYRTYEIFAVFTISSNLNTPFPYHLFAEAADQADYEDFVANCRQYAHYDTGIVPAYGEKLITLSTCEYTHVNGRLVVVARLVED